MKPQNRHTLRILLAILAVVSSLAVRQQQASGNTESYIDRFRDGDGSTTAFWIPSRNSSGAEVAYAVYSKWQQPRQVNGTTPHQGVDIGAPMNTPVYPAYKGWIVYQSGYNSNGTCCFTDSSGGRHHELVLRLDVNDNGLQDDAVYMKYDHVERVGFRSTGSLVTISDQVATSGDEDGAYGAHLHFGTLNPYDAGSRTGRWAAQEKHYTWSAAWAYGDDLDFISYHVKDADNLVKVTAYVNNDGVHQSLPAGNVRLFHRKAGTSTWASAVMTLGTADRWQVDVDTLGYPTGTSIQYFVRAIRSGLTDPHSAGFFPAQYAHANNDPNAVAAAYPYYTAVTQ